MRSLWLHSSRPSFTASWMRDAAHRASGLQPADALHRDCFCIAVDPLAVRAQLNAVLEATGTPVRLAEEHAHLFASLPIYIPEHTVVQMEQQRPWGVLTRVIATPAYTAAALGWAPAIASHDPGSPGGDAGFDFHLGPDGPRLIEINTNPGGLLLNAMRGYAQLLCFPSLSMPAIAADAADAAIDALLNEWRLQRGSNPEDLVAIVDEAPEQQYLFAEFVLFKQRLESRGYRAVICDPSELHYVDGALLHNGQRIGLVYNRLTDFALLAPSLQSLRQSYLDGNVALSPHPRAHALWADKRNLTPSGASAVSGPNRTAAGRTEAAKRCRSTDRTADRSQSRPSVGDAATVVLQTCRWLWQSGQLPGRQAHAQDVGTDDFSALCGTVDRAAEPAPYGSQRRPGAQSGCALLRLPGAGRADCRPPLPGPDHQFPHTRRRFRARAHLGAEVTSPRDLPTAVGPPFQRRRGPVHHRHCR